MRIESRTPDRMVVVSRPWIFTVGATVASAAPVVSAVLSAEAGGIAMRLFLLALGFGFLAAVWRFLPFLTLILDKASGIVTVVHHRVTGNTVKNLPLASLDGAMYQSDWSEGARLERLALRGPDGPIPVEFGYSGAARSQIADAINDWLTEPSA